MNEHDRLKKQFDEIKHREKKSALDELLSRLPHTKDGKPILWGDKVYFPDPDTMIHDREMDVIEGKVEAITISVQFKEYEGTHTIMFGDYESGNLELYSERELVPLDPAFEEE